MLSNRLRSRASIKIEEELKRKIKEKDQKLRLEKVLKASINNLK